MDRQAKPPRSPRYDAAIFVLLTFAISSVLQILLIRRDKMQEDPIAGFLAWTPSLVGLLLSWVLGYGMQGLGGKRTPPRSFALAAGVPFVAVLASYLGLSLSGNGSLRWPPECSGTAGAIAVFLYAAIGEEFGWRGFLQARLREARIASRWFLVGLVWSAWHYPLIFSGLSYASSSRPAISAALFTVTVTAYGIFLGWLRERYDSIWPVVGSHAVHNVAVLHLGPANLLDGPRYPYLVGDSGVFLALPYILIAVCVGPSPRNGSRFRC
jgi:membrane protease YdiL (CAAX protease family)